MSEVDIYIADVLRRLSNLQSELSSHISDSRAYQSAMTEKVDIAFDHYNESLKENQEAVELVKANTLKALDQKILVVEWLNFWTKVIASFLSAMLAIFGFIWTQADANFWHHASEAIKSFFKREGL